MESGERGEHSRPQDDPDAGKFEKLVKLEDWTDKIQLEDIRHHEEQRLPPDPDDLVEAPDRIHYVDHDDGQAGIVVSLPDPAASTVVGSSTKVKKRTVKKLKKHKANFRPNFDARHCCIATCNSLVNAVALVRISPKMYHLWAKHFDLKVHDRICYDHFAPDDYTVKDGCPRLCRGAMPTRNMDNKILTYVMEKRRLRSLKTEEATRAVRELERAEGFQDVVPAVKEPKEPTVPGLQRVNEDVLAKLVLARNQLDFANQEIARLKRRLEKKQELYRLRKSSVPKKRVPKIVQDYLMEEKKWPEGMAKHFTNSSEKKVFPHCENSMALAMYLRGAMGAHAFRVLKDANLLPLPTDSAVKKRKQAMQSKAEQVVYESQFPDQYSQIIVLEPGQDINEAVLSSA